VLVGDLPAGSPMSFIGEVNFATWGQQEAQLKISGT
jgi:hypothetical protein